MFQRREARILKTARGNVPGDTTLDFNALIHWDYWDAGAWILLLSIAQEELLIAMWLRARRLN